jgi:hypothetical protein
MMATFTRLLYAPRQYVFIMIYDKNYENNDRNNELEYQ